MSESASFNASDFGLDSESDSDAEVDETPQQRQPPPKARANQQATQRAPPSMAEKQRLMNLAKNGGGGGGKKHMPKQPTMEEKRRLMVLAQQPPAPKRGVPQPVDDSEDGTDEEDDEYEVPVKPNRSLAPQEPDDDETYEMPIKQVPKNNRAKSGGDFGFGTDAPPPAAPPRPSISVPLQRTHSVKPSWLKPALDRDEAERLVAKMNSGDFIIRSSTRSGYTLVVNDNGLVLNLPISKNSGMHCFGGQEYRSLPQLVDDLGSDGQNHMRSNETGGRLILNVPGQGRAQTQPPPTSPPSQSNYTQVKSLIKMTPPTSPTPPPQKYSNSNSSSSSSSSSSSRSSQPRVEPPKTKRPSARDPLVEQAAWFGGSISQNDAKKAVMGGDVGTFLVRDSSGKHVLVIRDMGKITSFQIRVKDGSCHFANRTFASIDAVVENLRVNAVRGSKNQALRPSDPAGGGWLHLSSARRIAKAKRLRCDIVDHAWWTSFSAKECSSILNKAAAGQFLVRPSSDASQIYVHVKDGSVSSGSFVQTYQFAKGNQGTYMYGGSKHPDIATVVDIMRKAGNNMPVPLSTPARGGNVHPSVFGVLEMEESPSADVRALSISNPTAPGFHQKKLQLTDSGDGNRHSTRRVFRLSDSGDSNRDDTNKNSRPPAAKARATAFQFWQNGGNNDNNYDSDEIDI